MGTSEMVKRLQKLKESRKRGFTLVELIVVLVILAILAALLIPALTGYIDKAKNRSVIAETRQVVMAAQTLVDEEYAKDSTFAATEKELNDTDAPKTSSIKELAEVKGTINTIKVSKGKVSSVEYTSTDGRKCTYTASSSTYEVDGENSSATTTKQP